eukprot:3560813-Rhodomonas_salina.2
MLTWRPGAGVAGPAVARARRRPARLQQDHGRPPYWVLTSKTPTPPPPPLFSRFLTSVFSFCVVCVRVWGARHRQLGLRVKGEGFPSFAFVVVVLLVVTRAPKQVPAELAGGDVPRRRLEPQ